MYVCVVYVYTWGMCVCGYVYVQYMCMRCVFMGGSYVLCVCMCGVYVHVCMYAYVGCICVYMWGVYVYV